MSEPPPVAAPPSAAVATGRRGRRRLDWRVVLIVGVSLSIAMGFVGLILDRNEIGAANPQGIYYVHQWHTPFEREIFLEPDHRAMLAEGDSELWYFAAGALLALTLASVPLLMERERRGREEPPRA